MTAYECGVVGSRWPAIAYPEDLFCGLADSLCIVTLLLRAQPAPSEMTWYVTHSTLSLAAEAVSLFWPQEHACLRVRVWLTTAIVSLASDHHGSCMYYPLTSESSMSQIPPPLSKGILGANGRNRATHHTRAASSSLQFTSLPIIPSSLQRSTSQPASTTQISTPTVASAWIFCETNGVQL